MRVLAFGSYDARSHPRIGVLIGGLRERGADVTELNVPLGLDTAARVAILRQPWRLPLLGWQLLRCWTRLGWQGLRLRRRGAHPDAVLVGYLGHFDVHLARLLFPRSRIVLDQLVFAADTARDRGERGRGKARLLTALDTAAVRAADIVVVDTAEHRALLAPGDRAKAVVVPVGAPREWFGLRAGADRGESPLRMVFFGLFTPLQGTPVVGAALGLVADERGIEALMIGHGQDLVTARAAAAANPRVSWRHWVPPEELPGLVASHDVCLGIFGTGPKALRVVPNKVYQG
ncbi:MAG TPA: hypothetical protein VNE21_09045, partial [Mycobacteriales bacterium]|nr:hypothetical protein [Mycobacteriales bacterium]